MEILISKKDNFKVWKKYEIMDKYKSILTTFLDNGILLENKEMFKDIYNEYKEYCNGFYKQVEEIYIDYKKNNNSNIKGLKFDLDFTQRSYQIKEVNDNFDLDNFALNSLQLDKMFEERISKVLKED
jgi:hypothetical protein